MEKSVFFAISAFAGWLSAMCLVEGICCWREWFRIQRRLDVFVGGAA